MRTYTGAYEAPVPNVGETAATTRLDFGVESVELVYTTRATLGVGDQHSPVYSRWRGYGNFTFQFDVETEGWYRLAASLAGLSGTPSSTAAYRAHLAMEGNGFQQDWSVAALGSIATSTDVFLGAGTFTIMGWSDTDVVPDPLGISPRPQDGFHEIRFRLTPVPEPSSLSALALALGIMVKRRPR